MAINCYAAYEARQALKPFSYDPGDLGHLEVEIEVTHCGICHSDIHLIDNDWGVSGYPLVPGHEVIGTVRAIGGAVRSVKVGQRVGLGWQCGSCMHCEWCVQGEETCCSQNQATAVGHYGGFGQAVRADNRFVFAIPDGLPSETAAPLLCGGVTVYTPLKKLARPSSRVGVIGIGGLGHMAIQFAAKFGCEVTAFSTTPGKEQEARKLGTHRFVVTTDKPQMSAAVGSIDVLVSAVTVEMDWAAWLQVLRPKGAIAIVGASPGTLGIPPMGLIMGDKSIHGSAIGNRSTIAEMLEFAARNGVTAQTEVMPMSRVNEALDKVRANKARYRMVLKN
jgi:alcohol/geraniol dehydrogenase (NADP+)